VHAIAGRTVFVFPLLHPAAALRTPSLVETLREDFAKLPALIAEPLPELEQADAADDGAAEQARPDPDSQLDLFA
jgi:DNA polymerase